MTVFVLEEFKIFKLRIW